MGKKTAFPIPPYYLFLDVIGAILIGVGLARYFGQVDIIPAAMRFENYDVYFLVSGFLLMLPAIFHLIGKAGLKQG